MLLFYAEIDSMRAIYIRRSMCSNQGWFIWFGLVWLGSVGRLIVNSMYVNDRKNWPL